MMATNLTKMVEDWENTKFQPDDLDELETQYFLKRVLKAMAAAIEGNTEALAHALTTCNNLLTTCKTLSKRIDLLRKETKP